MNTYSDQRWEKLFEAVHELSALISAGPHRESQILERILRSSQGLLSARFVHLFLIENGHIRRYVLHHDEDGRDVLSVQTLPPNPSQVTWIQQEQAAALVQRASYSQIGGFSELQAGEPIRAPLHTGARSHGVLIVFPGEGAYGEEDAKLLSYLANQAAVVLEHAELYRQLETEAATDGLTGLFNYRYFMDALRREISRAERFREPFALVMVDVDNLKEYNDRNGHLGGSSALQELARLLKEDAREIDIIAKYGGDEFCLILPNTALDGAVAYVERMRQQVERHRFQGDPRRRLTVTAGLALFPQDGRTPRDLLSRADSRLFAAKAQGKNRYRAHDYGQEPVTHGVQKK